jgi:hypothetical protein
MIGDLPELDNIFEDPNKKNEVEIIDEEDDLELIDKNIYIYISKSNNKWMSVSFLEVAPGGIGIHVLLPIEVKFNSEDLNNIQLKFVQKKKKSSDILKEVPVLLRWHEKDQLTGKMKLGLHFHGEIKNEPDVIEILEILKKQKTV